MKNGVLKCQFHAMNPSYRTSVEEEDRESEQMQHGVFRAGRNHALGCPSKKKLGG